MTVNRNRPLIEEAEGRDQDERSALIAAIATLLNQSDRRRVTDYHVFELIKWVHRLDKGKVGAQLSHYQIAKQLWLEVPTARSVLKRATDELGLLLKSEQRYVTNGQQANRYEINWQLVRSINRGNVPGDTRYQGGDTTDHPPATRYQGGDTTDHPYKEYPEFKPESKPEPPPPTERACANSPTLENQEEEVISFVDEEASPRRSLDAGLVLVRTERRKPSPGVRSPLVAKFEAAMVWDAEEILQWVAPQVSEEYLLKLLEYWQENKDRFVGAGALRLRLKRSRPDLPIEKGWPPPRPIPNSAGDSTRGADLAARRAAIAEAKRQAKADAEADVDLATQLKQLREKLKEQ